MMAGRGEESEERRAFRREVDWESMYSLLSTRTRCWRLGKRLRMALAGEGGKESVQRGSATATTDVEEAFGRKGGGEVKRYIVENPRRNSVARLRK